MVSLFLAKRYPAGRELRPSDQSVYDDTPVSDSEQPSWTLDGAEPTDEPPVPEVVPEPSDQVTSLQDPPPPGSGPELTSQDQQPSPGSDSSDSGTQNAPAPDLQLENGYIPPSPVPNDPQPTTTPPGNPPDPSSTIDSTSDLPVPNTVTWSTNTLGPAPAAAVTQGGALSTSLSNNKGYIIGGAAGGGLLLLILLVVLLTCCCRKRRAKKDIERNGDGHPGGQSAHGQFACCHHGTCAKDHGLPHMGERTPLRPFVLKSGPVAQIPKEVQQPHVVSLNRRDSTGSQKSAGSDTTSSGSMYSDRAKRVIHKRPPPLKLTSLVTPVINGPQHNPRDRAHKNPGEVPTIVVEPPRSETPERMRR